MSPSYLAHIPAHVRYNDTLSANAKIFYAEITALSCKYGYCFASNAHFAEMFKMSDRTASRLISELEKLGFISVKVVKNAQTGQVLGRRIYPDIVPSEMIPEGDIVTISHTTKLSGPVDKIVLDHTTNLSTGFYIKKEINKEENTRASSAPKKDAKSEMVSRMLDKFGDAAKSDLIPAVLAFCEMRESIKKPITPGRAVTTLANKIHTLSGGDISTAIALVDKATLHKWLSVFSMKEDELREALSNDIRCLNGEDGGPKWL